jgi:hypothetical protein
MKIARLAMLAIGLLIGASAFAQSYIPLQLPHEGHWYNPERSGEGIHVSVIDGERPVAFVVVFGLEEGRDYWASAQGVIPDLYPGELREFQLDLFQRPSPNEPPVVIGFITLEPIYGMGLWAEWAIASETLTVYRPNALFDQLTSPVDGFVGVCNYIGFSPRPPAPFPRFCN